MNSTDPISDLLTRIRNAIHANHKKIDVVSSGVKREIARILSEEKFVSSYTEVKDDHRTIPKIRLRYTGGINAITGLKRISKPGLRVYVESDKLPRVLNGLGIAILSTSRGVMTEKQARAARVGGEVLCHVW